MAFISTTKAESDAKLFWVVYIYERTIYIYITIFLEIYLVRDLLQIKKKKSGD